MGTDTTDTTTDMSTTTDTTDTTTDMSTTTDTVGTTTDVPTATEVGTTKKDRDRDRRRDRVWVRASFYRNRDRDWTALHRPWTKTIGSPKKESSRTRRSCPSPLSNRWTRKKRTRRARTRR